MIKRLIYSIIFVLLFSGMALSATYTVCSSGCDYTESGFESLSGSYAGDTFYFSGSNFNDVQVNIYGTQNSPVVLDGYQTGDCDAIDNDCANGAKLSSIDLDTDGVTVQDFEIDGADGYPNNAIYIHAGVDYVTIQRVYSHNTDDRPLYVGDTANNVTYLTVRDCKFSEYGQRGHNPPDGIRLYDVHDGIISGNVFTESAGEDNCGSCNGDNYVAMHKCDNFIFEYNTVEGSKKEAGMAIKESGTDGNNYIVVRFNKFIDNPGSNNGKGLATNWYTSNYFYIYGNLMANNGRYGIDIKDGLEYAYYWSNIIVDHGSAGFVHWYRAPDGYHSDHVYIYNNTIAHNELGNIGTNYPTTTGLTITDSSSTNIFIKNNFLVYNRPNAYGGQLGSTNTGIDLDYNTYYDDGVNNDLLYYNGGWRTLSWMVNNTDDCDNGIHEEPDFTDPDGADNTWGTDDDDFTLGGSHIDNGVDLGSATQWSVTVQGDTEYFGPALGLDPNNTDWTTDPPTVATLDHDENGAGWERGAYVYNDNEKPANSQGVTFE